MRFKYNLLFLMCFVTNFFFISSVNASPSLGTPAPQFKDIDSNGNEVSLSDFQGKIVILEWTNHDCPYVRRQYMTGNMQMVQVKAKDMGVVWISIISSAPGTQGHVNRRQANKLTASRKALPSHVVMDPSGVIGKLYGARTTPHMYIVDTKGILVYKGAIDDKPTSWGKIDAGTKNYVLDALSELMAGNRITHAATQPYGCSVKYGS